MGQTERILRIQQMLRERKSVAKSVFLQELEISEAQFKRDLALIRDRFQVPIEWDQRRGGYVIPDGAQGAEFELPGPMYTATEINALLLMQDLVGQLQPGLLDEYLSPLRERLKLLLGSEELQSDEIRRRIRILQMASRPVEPRYFRTVSQGTLARRRLQIRYYSRSRDQSTERQISPQRLVFYRGNWYLDSWCHLRQDLRSFAVDAIASATILHEAAQEIAGETLDAHLGAGYGIFAGPAEREAVLRFEPESARWVLREVWHSLQKQTVEPSGHLLLSIPYAQEKELLMDILRYGSNVEVLFPDSLRRLVQVELERAREKYFQVPEG